MKITNPITLDVARSNSYICLLAKQFDENSRFLIATLTNNGEPMIIPAGAAVTLRATRPDGEPVAVPGIINNDGTTTVEIDDYILEVVGSASLSIEVAIGDEILTSASFNLTIQRADGNGWLRVYVAAASLAAGNYYITIGDTPYAFTTTQAIPAGGAIYFNSDGGTAQTRDASGNVLDASLTLTAGTSGTELTSDVPTMSFLTAIAGRMATIEAEMSQKANIDGSYPLLNAGSADNLMTDNGATQAIPFIQEGTGKGNGEATVKAGGVLQLKKKLGNTVAVNQLQPAINSNWQFSNATGTIADGKATFTASARYGLVRPTQSADRVSVISGHYYLVGAMLKLTSATTNVWVQVRDAGETNTRLQLTPQSTTSPQFLLGVYSAPTTETDFIRVIDTRTSGWDAIEASNLVFIDLTLWFGSNDRIPSDLLSHPENWGRYYAGSLDYDAGHLDSADGSVLTSLSRNIFNKATSTAGKRFGGGGLQLVDRATGSVSDYIPTIPNTQYYARKVSGSGIGNTFVFYDGNKDYIGEYSLYGSTGLSGTVTVPSNCRFIRFQYETADADDVTFSIYYTGESGYDESYPFSVLAEVDTGSEVLRGVEGSRDEKLPNGTITRRRKIIDLGTLNYQSGTAGIFFSDPLADTPEFNVSTTDPKVINPKYIYASSAYGNLTNDKVFCINGGRIWIVDTAYSDVATFKSAMSGVKFEYPLATPTTEQGTAFAENISCDPDGTLSWTQTKGIPQGNEIFYPTDLKGALESIVAALPSANGTYTLHATVTTAGVTFSWS